MLRVTRWRPDTCDCIFEYEWDDTQSQDARTHSFKKAVQLCEHHQTLLATKAYDEVISENSRKNTVFTLAQEIKSDIALEDYTWSFDKIRKLKVGFLGKLKGAEKAQLKTLCSTRFEAGKIEVI